MGDIADGLINGDFDSETGEYLGEGPGYPRTRSKSLPWEKGKSVNAPPGHINRIRALVKELKIYKKWHHVAYEYRKVPPNKRSLDPRSLQRVAKGICNEFGAFETYCKTLITKKDEQTK